MDEGDNEGSANKIDIASDETGAEEAVLHEGIVNDEKAAIDGNGMQQDEASPIENGEESIKIDAVETEDSSLELMLRGPPINCMEKIVFFVDISSEMSNTSFNQSKSRHPLTFLQHLQKTFEIFLATKHIMNPLHQYALALLQNETIFWYQEFTNDIQHIEEIIMELEPAVDEDHIPEFFSFDHVIQILKDHCELPAVTDVALPPPYIVQCIFIYGRSKCELTISSEGKDVLKELKKSPYFFLDVLYLHDPPSQENKAKEVYDFFCNLDKEELGYVLEVSNSVQWLYEGMAKLLCHPLQRCQQSQAFYDLMPSIDV